MTAHAAGTVTNCTYAGAGGLQAALTGGGTVTFACDGTIVVPQISISANTEIDATGHDVTLSGNNANRVFVVASSRNLTLESITIANGQGPTSSSGCPNYCGGGVLVNAGGQLTVRGSIFSDNSADSGGAINSNHGTLLVENSEFVRNKASSGRGGAILTTRVNANAVSTTIAGTTFRDNSAGRDGGALAIFVGTGSISNSTFHGNVSGGEGGAIIHWSDGSLSVDSATIAENSARRGGGFRILGAGPTALKNTIVYGNRASTGPDISGPVTSNNHNLIGTTSGATITPQANDIIGQDPLLGPLANNGGTTQTRVLLPGSPAIDTGNTTLTTDQRGITRPQGAADDIGAVEDNCTGSPYAVGNEQALNSAIACFNAATTPGSYTINVTQGISLTASTVTISNTTSGIDLHINGGGFAVDGQGTSGVRVFDIAAATTVTMNAITVTRGNVAGGKGGGIQNLGSLTVNDSTISHNSGRNGAGINNRGTLVVNRSTFLGNDANTVAAGNGGGLLNTVGGNATINNSTFSGNNARNGAGLYNSVTLVVDSTTFADSIGGAYFQLGGIATFSNSILADSTNALGDCRIVFGVIVDGGHNLVETPSTCAPLFTSPTTLLGQDPKLGALANNGGPTQTHALLPGSPALDAGDTTLTTDQRGEPRPHGLADDIGAYESQANGTIIIAKQTAPLNQGDFDFTHNITATTTFTLAGGQSETFLNVAPGTYTVTEAVEPLWRLVDLRCDDAASPRPSSGSTITRTATIAVEPGETVTCTFTNSEDDIIIVQKRTLPAGGSGFDFTVGGELTGTFTLDDGQLQVLDVISGTYTISETDRSPAYTLDSIECTIFGPGPNDEAAVNGNKTTGSVDMALTTGQAAFCLFTNLKAGSITIEKSADPADNTPFDFGITGGRGADVLLNEAFTLRDPLTTTKTFTDVVPGAYALGEDPVTGWSPRTINCDSPGASSYDYLAPGEVSIALAPGDDVTCTFENTKLGTLTIVKDADPADNTPFTYDIVSANPLSPTQFSLQDPLTSTRTYTDIFPQGYTVSEQAVAGWSLADITCQSTLGTSNFVVDRAQREVLVVLAAGDDATCTFINKKNGSITIVKSADPADDTSFNFGITGGSSGFLLNEAFTLRDPLTTTKTFTNVAPGAYSVGEDPVTGWSPRTINCDSPGTSSYDYFAPGEVSIALALGDDVTCTFENTKLGTLTIVKDADPADNTPFTYDIVSANPLSPTQFSLQDPLASTRTYTDVFPQGYTVSEQAAAGWSLDDITCQSTLGTSNFVVDRAQREVLVVLAAGDDATCTFINKKNGSITLIKDANPADNTRFAVTVGDPNNQLATYDLRDSSAPSVTISAIPGLYQVSEKQRPGWTLNGVDCQSALGTTTFDKKRTGVELKLAVGDDVTCTLHNVKPGSLTVVKQSVGSDASFTFTSQALSSFVLTTTNGTAQKSFATLLPGTYDLAEVVPTGWQQVAATCSDGSNPASVTVDPGESVTCTFTNQQLDTIVIEKRTVGADGTFAFTSQRLGNFNLKTQKGVGRSSFSNLAPGTYDVTESAAAGWTQTVADPTCSNGDPASSINLSAGETVVCVFVNLKQDSITVEKRTIGGDGSFDFASPQLGNFRIATINGSEIQSFTGLTPTTYSISESVPAGWVQSGASCSDGSNPTSISLTPGATVSCIFTNTKLSSITVVKQTRGGDDSFTFTGDLGTIPLTTVGGTAQQRFGDLAAGTYSISETVPAGWDLLDATCSDGSDPASISLAAGEDVICTFENDKRGRITVVKKTIGGDGNFTFDSQVLGSFVLTTTKGNAQQSFANLVPGTYDVTELNTSEWSLTSASCSDGSAPDKISLSAGEEITCTFENSKRSTIAVVKVALGGDDAFTYTSQTLGSFVVTTTNGEGLHAMSGLPSGVYDIQESAAPGWTSVDADPVCSNGDKASKINLNDGATVVCFFVNVKQNAIAVEKQTVGGDGSFAFSSNLPGNTTFSVTTASGVARTAFTGLNPGTYSISESVPVDWMQSSATCSDGSNPASIALTAGKGVVCTFKNTKLGKIVVVKRSVGGDDTFEFGGNLGSFNLKTANGLAKRDFLDLAAGSYTITETVPAGWELSSAVCTDGSNPAKIDLAAGEEVTCFFEDTKQGSITIVKKTVNGDGTFAFASQSLQDFDLITNGGIAQRTFDKLTPGLYDVVENAPAGWSLTGTTCSDGSNPALIQLDPGESVTCTFVNETSVQATGSNIYLPLIMRDGQKIIYLPVVASE